MPDHYRALIQSLRDLGFLFSRLGEGKQEVWRNRLTDKEVMFDRREAAASREGVEKVVKQAKAAKPGERATARAIATAFSRLPDADARVASAPAARPKAKASRANPKPASKAAGRGKRKAGGAKPAPGRHPR